MDITFVGTGFGSVIIASYNSRGKRTHLFYWIYFDRNISHGYINAIPFCILGYRNDP